MLEPHNDYSYSAHCQSSTMQLNYLVSVLIQNSIYRLIIEGSIEGFPCSTTMFFNSFRALEDYVFMHLRKQFHQEFSDCV